VVLCRTWSENSIAPSQFTQCWQIQDPERFLIPCPQHISSQLPLAVKPAGTPWCLLPKQTWRDSLPIDMLLSFVSDLVVALPSLKFQRGLWVTLYYYPFLCQAIQTLFLLNTIALHLLDLLREVYYCVDFRHIPTHGSTCHSPQGDSHLAALPVLLFHCQTLCY
jgi:hypothetical protein